MQRMVKAYQSSLAPQVWSECRRHSKNHSNKNERSKGEQPIALAPPRAERPSQRNVGNGWPSRCPPTTLPKDKHRSDEASNQTYNQTFFEIRIQGALDTPNKITQPD
jgi:hypothetical protein